jgi:pimeloyl-ACP methyl ester carboxylesterase
MNGTWTRVDIAGKPADVYDLRGGERPRFGVLFLHPVGQESLDGNAAFTSLFDELRLCCVCPAGGFSWWADRICPDFDPIVTAAHYVLDSVLPFFASHWGLRPPAIGLTGISMGGQGALRLAFEHPTVFPVVAAISSAIEYHLLHGRGYSLDAMYDSKEQCRQDTAPMHIHPSHYPPHIDFCIDPDDRDWFRGNDRLHEKLAALGVPHTCDLTTRAGGHSWAYFDHMASRAVRFLEAGLAQESRRLL